MPHTIYANQVLENKLENLLTTAIDMNSYMTIDNSLAQDAGMKKVINVYTASGSVEDLAMGVGNTSEITMSFTPSTYTVGVTQGKFAYYDEQEMTDPAIVEYGIKALSEKMVNDLVSKAVTEFGKATLTQAKDATNGLTFNVIVDAISKYPYEDESGLTLMINPAQLAQLRKNLGDDLKYSEGFARTGYVGSVCGVPVVVSKGVTAGTAFLFHKSAVTCFVKKGSEIEQERDADTRCNTVFARKVAVVALTDATKIVKIA